ncbi:MAG: magnesium chelatase, partial [bacterium]
QELIEETAVEARSSELVDQNSGVSVRLTITLLENLVSNMERRALRTSDKSDRKVYPRLVDLRTALAAVTGKIELVHEGEQEGPEKVARHILGKAVRKVFLEKFPAVHPPGRRRRRTDPGAFGEEAPEAVAPTADAAAYAPIVQWFATHRLELSDETPFAEHLQALRSVTGLEECARTHLAPASPGELAGAMELVLDGLHQCSMLAKEDGDGGVGYRDMIGAMFRQMEEID